MIPFADLSQLRSAFAEKKHILNTSPIPAKDLGLFRQLAEEYALPRPITQMLLHLTNPTSQ